jgi:hypothetical protein
MLSFLKQYARDYVFSQNGEEGILLECLNRMFFTVNKGHAVEIGGADGRFCSNTALLLQQHGWSGLFVESDYDLYLKSKENWDNLRLPVRHQCCYVDGNNINAFVDEACDLLSIDTDGHDYEIFDGLKAKPKIVIVEIDSSLTPDYSKFNDDGGANYFAMTLLGITKGYFLLCHTGNLVMVHEDYRHLFPEIQGDPLVDVELYFNRGWL